MRRVRHNLSHAAINRDIGWTLSQTHVVNTDVHRSLISNRLGYRMRFPEIGDHDHRQRFGFPIANFRLKSGRFEKPAANLGNRIDRGGALKRAGDSPAPDGMSESQ